MIIFEDKKMKLYLCQCNKLQGLTNQYLYLHADLLFRYLNNILFKKYLLFNL